MSPNDADGMANSVDLIRVCTVCPGISVRKLRIITVVFCNQFQHGQGIVRALTFLHAETAGEFLFIKVPAESLRPQQFNVEFLFTD